MPITILDLGPDIVAMRMDGRTERHDIDAAFAAWDRAIAGGGAFRVYAEVHSFSGISFEALARDIKLGFQRLDTVSRIERAAVVTDIEWMKKAAQLQDRAMRNIDIRVFAMAEMEQARNWIREPAAPAT
ncbi:MAG: SpoIIAA family protein [Longimicrobiales bacterium]